MQPAIKPTPAARNETVTMRNPALSGAGRSAVLTPVTAKRALSVFVLPTIVAELFASAIRSLPAFPRYGNTGIRDQLLQTVEQSRPLRAELRTVMQRKLTQHLF